MDRNVYSVDSRLIGEWVDVRLYAEELEVWFAGKAVERTPRLRGRQEASNQLPACDRLVGAKPGAFERIIATARTSIPRADFGSPTTHCERHAGPASREYLQILELAARESESMVDNALRALLEEEQTITAHGVREWIGRRETARPVTEVQVDDGLVEF